MTADVRPVADVRTVLAGARAVVEGRGDGEARRVLAAWTVDDWRSLLRDLPMDSGTYSAQLESSWDTSITDLEAWCTALIDAVAEDGSPEQSTRPADGMMAGYVSLVLLTLVSLRQSEHRRTGAQHAPPLVSDVHDCDGVCRRLVREPAVRAALRELYAPPPGSRQAGSEWDTIDFSTLAFHRHGTTSFILRGTPLQRAHGQLQPFALKCIIYPFLRIPTIGRATEAYADDYAVPDTAADHLVRVWASSTSWVLMDYVAGETLAERLTTEIEPRREGFFDAFFPSDTSGDGTLPAHPRLRLDLVERFGHELFLALADLERCGLRHCDLSPSNIIVVSHEGRETLKFIDLGVNYLYLHNIPGRAGLDAGYIAPEIRTGDADAADTGPVDLYSFGQLLVLLGAGHLEHDGTVPGIFYAEAPLIARFVEDLTDRNPDRRLLIFGRRSGASTSVYDDLRTCFTEELEAVKAERVEHSASRLALVWSDVVHALQPLSGALGRQRRLWRVRRQQRIYRDATRNMRVRWLLAWSTVSAACCALTSTIVLMWTFRGAGWDWDNQVIVFLQKLFGASPEEFPLLDQLRADDYQLPPGVRSTALGVLGLSFTLVGVKYYQSLFAGVSPLVTGWRAGTLSVQAALAEVAMRSWTVMPLLTILPPFLYQPRTWPLFVAGAMTIVTVANWASSQFARTALSRGREYGLSTVPGRVNGVSTYASWIPGNTFYAMTLWLVGGLLYVGAARDAMVYIVGITLVNVLQLYLVKCGFQGPDIRAGLARACITAERLRHVTG